MKTKHILKKSLFSMAVLFIISCGGGGEYSISEFSSDFDQTACDKLVECDVYETTTECLNNSNSNLDESNCPDFDEDLAQECLDQLEALDCDFDGPLDACEEVCPDFV